MIRPQSMLRSWLLKIAFGISVTSWALLLTASAETPATTASDDIARILALENAWNQAEVRHDGPAMSLLIADTFLYIDDDGSQMDREQWLTHVRSRADDYTQLANSAMVVRSFGNFALVTGEYHEKIREKGRTLVRSGHFTDVWIEQAKQWKCVSSQSTLIAP